MTVSDNVTWVIEALDSGIRVHSGEYFIAFLESNHDEILREKLMQYWDLYKNKWPHRYVLMGPFIADFSKEK